MFVVTHNKNKKVTTRLVITIPIIGMSVTLLALILAMGPNGRSIPAESVAQQEKVTTANTIAADTGKYGLPMRLSIPKIDVDSSIVYMGLTSSGDMESPKTNEESGWYKYGPHPGNAGSAVIAGHLGVGSRAVFAQLSLLKKGDVVYVLDDRNQTVSFVVRDTRTYDYDTEPSEVFSSTSGTHLNLITCNGDWDSEQKTYAKRLVVFTDKF